MEGILFSLVLVLAVLGLMAVVAFLRERSLRQRGRQLLNELEEWRGKRNGR